MKIQGPTQTHVNIYKEHAKQQPPTQTGKGKADQLEISPEAHKLQKGISKESERDQYVQQIKQAYDHGTYQPQPEKIASKMIDFWRR